MKQLLQRLIGFWLYFYLGSLLGVSRYYRQGLWLALKLNIRLYQVSPHFLREGPESAKLCLRDGKTV